MQKLTDEGIQAALTTVPGWTLLSGEIIREFRFPGFLEAIAFVNRIAPLAEAAGHHPDIDIRYNRVRLALMTHDAGGLTRKDFDLALHVEAALPAG